MIEKFVAQGEGGGSKLIAAALGIYLYDCQTFKTTSTGCI